jgi:hypothetical protein
MYNRKICVVALLLFCASAAACLHAPSGHFALGPFVENHNAPGADTAMVAAPGVPILGATPPVFVPIGDSKIVWQATVDVIDDYFRIKSEQPVRHDGGVVVEGLIETHPLTGATYFEPWRRDSVGSHDRLESTLQSIRRTAYVRVTPEANGYWIDVRIDKELEDVQRPEHSVSAPSAVQYEQSIDKKAGSLIGPPLTLGWIPQGRDALLEQEIQRSVNRYLSPLLSR